jgi:S1-C subfamily serine protease
MIEKRRESKCIHCHDVKVAALRDLQRKSMLQRNMVFTYPPPTTVGIELDPMVQNQVGSVRPGSAAERAGIRSGDLIRTVAGERVFTMADFQDALEPQPPTATVPIELMRGDETVRTVLNLSGEWRRSRDPSWRESLYVVGPGGGFWGERLNEGDRKKHGLDPSNLAVRVTAVYGQHARDAGIKNGDIVVAFDGLRNDLTILQLHAHLQLDRPYGASIPIAVRRDGKQHDLVLRLPEHPSED